MPDDSTTDILPPVVKPNGTSLTSIKQKHKVCVTTRSGFVVYFLDINSKARTC